MANLEILTGSRKGQTLPLRDGRTVLGRDPGCHVVIDEAMLRTGAGGEPDSISRRHAVISRLGEDYYIEDGNGEGRSSRNGTYVNGRKVPFPDRVLLQDNDQIRICSFACTFRHDPDSALAVESSLDSSSLSLRDQPAERLQVVLQISNDLNSTLDLDVLLSRVIDHLFCLFRQAERGLILLCDDRGTPVVQAFKVRRPGDEAGDRFSASVVRRCLEKREALLANDLPTEFPDSPSVVALPIRSLMCAPLCPQGGRALGAIQLDSRAPAARFTADDLKLLGGVAGQASIAVCNARLHREALAHQLRERDLEVARQVQRSLLPQEAPTVGGYTFHTHYEPAQEVGGDYYDFVPLPGGRLALLLGDVAGKGVAAALVMVKFSVEARQCLLTEPDLAVAVSKLNTLMIRAGVPDRFVTLVAAVLDPVSHTLRVVNAAHPSPLLYRAATGTVEDVVPPALAGPAVGIEEGSTYTVREVRLQPGDGLVLFSDGVTDAENAGGRRFRAQGVRAVLGSRQFAARETGEVLLEAVRRYARGCEQADDITLVCLGRTGL